MTSWRMRQGIEKSEGVGSWSEIQRKGEAGNKRACTLLLGRDWHTAGTP